MRSISGKHILAVFEDTFVLFMIWALWAVAVLVVGFLLALPFVQALRSLERSVLTLITNPAQIFMFVVGIITGVYIIQYYIRQGVTRRSSFCGMVLAGLAVAISIQVIGVLLTGFSILVEFVSPFQAGRALIPYLGRSRGYLATIAISVSIHAAHFLMGWIIGFAFYRFRGLGGFAAILSGILVLGALSMIWGHGGIISVNVGGEPVALIAETFSPAVTLSLTTVLIAAQIMTLFLMVRNAPIKVQ